MREDALAVLALPPRDPSRHRLPLTEILVDEPIDQLRDAALDLLRRIGDDLLFELALHARAVQQIEDAADAQRVVEVAMAAGLHLDEHFLDRAHAQIESAPEVGAVLDELPLDLVERGHIARQQREPLLGYRQVAPRQRVADAERARQLQLEAAPLVQRLVDVAFERIESARLPQRRLAVLRPIREARAHRKDQGPRA